MSETVTIDLKKFLEYQKCIDTINEGGIIFIHYGPFGGQWRHAYSENDTIKELVAYTNQQSEAIDRLRAEIENLKQPNKNIFQKFFS